MNVKMQEYYVYILANKRNGTLYTGMTKDLAKRLVRHRSGRGSKFVQKYNLHRLFYYEKVNGYLESRRRERQLKWWRRKWKLALIKQMNPEWKDLREEILGPR
jgi:putative endonuclease